MTGRTRRVAVRDLLRLVPFLVGLSSLCCLAPLRAAEWQNLLADGLDEWVVVGDGVWTLRADGVLIGHRKPTSERESLP